MVLTKREREDGYELQWHDRNTRILTLDGMVVGKVENQNQLAFEIEAHKRYLDVINRNKSELEDDDLMTTPQAIGIAVVITALMALALWYSYLSDQWKV